MNQKSVSQLLSAVLVLMLLAHTAQAQGLQTGTVTGIVSSQDDAPLPGVTGRRGFLKRPA